MIGLLAHPSGGRQSIDVVKRMTLREVLEWSELLSEVSAELNKGSGDG